MTDTNEPPRSQGTGAGHLPAPIAVGPNEYYLKVDGKWLLHKDAPSEAAWRVASLFWIRLVGWVVLIGVLLSIAGGVWFAIEATSGDEANAATTSESNTAVDDCIEAGNLTDELCEQVYGD